MSRLIIFITLISQCMVVIGASLGDLKVSEKKWNNLAVEQKEYINNRYLVEISSDSQYGKIIDAQWVNESYYNTGAGSRLGSTLGQATYLDDTNWHDYSAKNQVGAAILGSLVGSMLDKPTEIKYHFRYTMKTSSGDIITQDKYSSSKFHTPVGVCVNVNTVEIVNDKSCEESNIDTILKSMSVIILDKNIIKKKTVGRKSIHSIKKSPSKNLDKKLSHLVTCKIGTSSTFITTQKKCSLVSGRIIK